MVGQQGLFHTVGQIRYMSILLIMACIFYETQIPDLYQLYDLYHLHGLYIMLPGEMRATIEVALFLTFFFLTDWAP